MLNLNFEAAILNVSLLWMLTAPHEFAHAWTAVKLGDETPRLDGRVTLNPMAHVDWLGTVILPLLTSLFAGGFLGWGKPVRVNTARLRGGNNGLLAVALAGPASNFVFAFVLAAAGVLLSKFYPPLFEFAAQGVYLSIYLALFNLLPVPPLDGSKFLLAAHIPDSWYDEIARFGFIALLVGFSATGLGAALSRWSVAGMISVFNIVRF